MSNETELTRAKKTVGARLGFYIHLTAFVLVNALLVIINLVTSPERLWFYWPLLGWGIGIIAHGLATFGLPGVRDRMIENELRKGAPKE